MAFKLLLVGAAFAAGVAGTANRFVPGSFGPAAAASVASAAPARFYLESATGWRVSDGAGGTARWTYRVCVRNEGLAAPVRFLSARVVFAGGREMELMPADDAAPIAVAADGWVNIDLYAAEPEPAAPGSSRPETIVLEGTSEGRQVSCEAPLTLRIVAKP